MKITLSKLSTKDLATLAQRLINTSASGNYLVINSHPLINEVKSMYEDYDAVYTKPTFSGKGRDVTSADRERDLAFTNLKSYLNSYRKMNSLPNHQYAEDLYQIFKIHGLDLDRMSYSSQSAQMKKLIETLQANENIQKLMGLSLHTAFSEMKSKQNAFETIFAEQAEANADLRQMKSATAIRRDLEKTLKSFLNLITAMKDVPDWQLLYFDINELIKAGKNSTAEIKKN
jgi:Fe-S cluster assembly scaffold protein SufB